MTNQLELIIYNSCFSKEKLAVSFPPSLLAYLNVHLIHFTTVLPLFWLMLFMHTKQV